MIEEASRKAIVECERRTVTPAREGARRQLFQEMEMKHRREFSSVPEKSPERTMSNEVTTDVDNVSKQIEKLGKQIEELKKRGEIVSQNRSSSFTNWILLEVVDSSFRFPDLSKYDGSKDPREHVAAFDLVMNLYGQTDSIKAKLFVTTLKGKAQEWFTSLGSGTIDSYEQLIHKFSFHFASKRKAKRTATYLFTIRQRDDETLKNFMGRFDNEVLEVQDLRIDMMVSIMIHSLKKGPFAYLFTIRQMDDETLKNFMGRFNNEVLEVQDLRIDMMVSILIHSLKKGPFASALAKDPQQEPSRGDECHEDNEWARDLGRSRDKRSKEGKQRSEKDRERRGPYLPKYHRYTPLNTTGERVMMLVEKEGLLQRPGKMRDTPAKKNSNKYCRFHKHKGHDTEDCYQLKDEIERLIRQGYFRHLIENRSETGHRSRSRSHERNRKDEAGKSIVRDNAPTKGIIHTISGGPIEGDSSRARKRYARENRYKYGGQMMHVESQEDMFLEIKT
ncbi:UNVERIFIED_CONTAM: hypothetical protein Sindi_2251400 [Sesamum indicum]